VQTVRYAFTVKAKDKTYDCERVVTGKRVLRQTIHIKGIGSKLDPASYGPKPKHSSIITMENVARLIAREIIREV
jgi:hypothetical protein